MILDVYMPHLTGIELTKILRENDYKTKIVLITAHSNDSLLLEAINIDVNYYLIKPATLKKVKDMLDKISIDLLRSSEKIVRFDENIYFNQNIGHTITSYGWYAPAYNPKFVLIVSLERPRTGIYSETTSSALYSEIAGYLLGYYKVPKNQ